jgi:hypothetical protein
LILSRVAKLSTSFPSLKNRKRGTLCRQANKTEHTSHCLAKSVTSSSSSSYTLCHSRRVAQCVTVTWHVQGKEGGGLREEKQRGRWGGREGEIGGRIQPSQGGRPAHMIPLTRTLYFLAKSVTSSSSSSYTLCFRNTMGGVSSDPSRLLAAALHSFTKLQGQTAQHSTAPHVTRR